MNSVDPMFFKNNDTNEAQRAQTIKEIANSAGIDPLILNHMIENPNQRHTVGDVEYTWFDELEVLIKFEGSKSYCIKGRPFDTLEEVLAIKKNHKYYDLDNAIEEYYESFYKDHDYDYNPFEIKRETVIDTWNSVEPMSKEEVKNRYDGDLKKFVLNYIEENSK